MSPSRRPEAVVVGSGPNGLAAAVELARAGVAVRVIEGADAIGGGTRTEPLTLPGFLHDVCSAAHPMGASSPFFRALPLAERGLEWVHPDAPVAHPFDDGTAAVLARDTADTERTLDRVDRGAWAGLFDPFVAQWDVLVEEALRPLRLPRRPLVMARFGLQALRSAAGLARARFRGERARALFMGMAGHVLDPLDRSPTAAFGLALGAAGHAVGWPFARGGSASIARALVAELRHHGGVVETGRWVRDLSEVEGGPVLLDLTTRGVLSVCGERLPRRYRRALERYRYAAGVFKVDWALSEPIPWTAPEVRAAGTVHLGGGSEEILAGSRAPAEGRLDARPLVILTQPTLFDRTRAPQGRHVAWAYCHVPLASGADRTTAIEDQVECFAPGFRDTILARSSRSALDMEAMNPNLVGGDINGGSQLLSQLFSRPAARVVPYSTPLDDVWVCSASTPPGGGVHGLCGYHAARAVLARLG
ncbi:MAG TPA: NAD(P)/FAD-dependent oxidoreductase [Longimicrobiales bacterium]|nr:NAD(P)/FAD-dependent oxidoreductase [Longimicrobiales bacterium]